MPYRRLPNTDAARLKALQTAAELGDKLSPRDLAFSASLLYKIKSFLPRYKNNLQIYQHKKERLAEESRVLQQNFRRAKMYLNHFIQVALFSIQRGELPEETMEYYGISEPDALPHIQSYQDLTNWCQQVLNGEMERTRKGMPPVTNPTAGVVRVHFDHFMDQYRKWETLQKSRDRDQEKIKKNRVEANELIATLWDEIENTFSDLPGEHKRKRAAEYGIQYVYRSNELRHLESLS